VWFVGDNLKYDVVGPQKYGLWSVWYNRKGNERGDVQPDLEIKNWEELAGVLKTYPNQSG
jgi:FMN phosphatase YigB (HAD superfamily)